jgi:hypothetical protein
MGNYMCAPTLVEVPFQGLTPGTNDTAVPYQGSTPTNAAPSAVNNSEGANDNVPELNGTHLSAITANGDDRQCARNPTPSLFSRDRPNGNVCSPRYPAARHGVVHSTPRRRPAGLPYKSHAGL